ncbi:MAG TPA: DsrE family protein [Thermodesulfobacteriota bacterium]|nr:DsrE family protein [Thermodesulfobacteriota bacterium]
MGIVTMVLNDAPYGIEKAWNALRLAGALLVSEEKVNIFLLGDAVVSAKSGQETPKGYYNLAEMIKDVLSKGGIVKACRTCIKARGIKAEELVEGVQVGRMLELANWVKESDKVLTF